MDTATTATYAFRYLPPRESFPATITPAEAEIVGQHFLYLKGLYQAGRVQLVGRCDNGRYGLALVRADSPEEAARLYAADPAVRAGLFKGEAELFLTVFPA